MAGWCGGVRRSRFYLHWSRSSRGTDPGATVHRPKGWRLERDPYLLETNIPGVFAVGDVRHGSVKRVASGVGEGSI